MRIENEIKLDFSDVLIKPKRSTLGSRSEVDITRQFTFRNSGQKYHGVAIIGANMDGIGTFGMAKAFAKMASDDRSLVSVASVALVKHYSNDQIVSFYREYGQDNVWYTLGSSSSDRDKLLEIVKELGEDAPKRVCRCRSRFGRAYLFGWWLQHSRGRL